ncbi:hypothetical protein TI39_contig455g00004 [Zymoseptoria brevis]|uniref:Cupin type-1 domain-containing protein n=1 Tax=Zymoseptoria brevis TaxID=1047168 RepID=A0A0F4GNT8_9PEZI|nr:hypothetical protein TI39_contig455g00004 [Zymoseptoria brevis]
MVVLSDTAIVRFGVADTVADLEKNTHGDGKEPGGIEIEANAGDVFVLPAGLAHKAFDTLPSESFRLLTPGEAKGIAAEDVGKALNEIQLSGRAYPQGSKWDFEQAAEDHGQFEKSWNVPRRARDPVLGDAVEGLCGQWNDASVFKGRL